MRMKVVEYLMIGLSGVSAQTLTCPGNPAIEPFDVKDTRGTLYPKPRVFNYPFDSSARCYTTQYIDRQDVGSHLYFDEQGKRIICPKNQMAAGNNTCIDIPGGFYRSSNNDLSICPAGYLCWPAGSVIGDVTEQGSKYQCPAGTRCEAGQTSSPKDCAVGFYSSQGSGFCSPCVGSTVADEPGSVKCKQCPSGQVASEDKTQCITCSSGTFRENNSCSNCTMGFYQNEAGKDKCKACPKGFYCPNERMEEPKPCDRGMYCPETEMKISYSCSDIGKVNNVTGRFECDSCNAGQIPDPFGYECEACQAGEYAEKDAISCLKCDLGTYNDEIFGLANCKNCPKGSYCNELGMVNPKLCPRGFECPRNNMVSADACIGREYQDDTGQQICKTCEIGFVSIDENTACAPCKPGFQQFENECRGCVPGTYQDDSGKNFCDDCPTGFYCPEVEAISPIPCPIGYECPQSKLTAPELCPLGEFSEAKGAETCAKCPANTVSNEERTGCNDCNLPKFIINGACIEPCGPGSYLPNGGVKCELCPAGTYNDEEDRRNNCKNCGEKYYCPGPGSKTRILCPIGSFCNENRLSEPKPCSEDRIAPNEGQVECQRCQTQTVDNERIYYVPNSLRSECIECLQPRFESNGVCYSECPPGTRRDIDTEGNYQCTKCLPGTYNDIPGADTCKTCIFGNYCPEVGMANMMLCPAGYYCNENGTIEPKICLAGSFCEKGSINPEVCTGNTYAPEDGLSECLECGSNLIPNDIYTECVNCPNGSYVNSENLSECKLCEPGYKCDKNLGVI